MANDIELKRTGTLDLVKDNEVEGYTEGDNEDSSVESDPLTRLRKAVRDGRSDLVPLLLGHFPKGSRKLNERDKEGFAAIHYAARFNRATIMNQLLSALPDTNVKTRDGVTALHFAARHLPRPCTVPANAPAGQSDAFSSSQEVIRMLLRAHIDHPGCSETSVTIKNSPQANTALHMACLRGNLPAVEELVGYHMDLDPTDLQGDTPLHEACRHGHLDIIKILLDRGANILAVNKDSETALHIACKEGHADVVKELLKPGRGVVKSMIAAHDHTGNTPIHCAVESGVFEIVEVLLSLSADPNVRNIDGIHPIHMAAAQGYAEIAKVLLQHHDKVKDALDGELRTPLHHAAIHNQVPIIEHLLRKGANKDALDEDSSSPLLLAAVWGRRKAIVALLKGGAQVCTTDNEGRSAVYWAAQNGQVEVLNVLLKHEGGIQLCNVAGFYHHNTPLHIAAYKGQTEAIKTMVTEMENHCGLVQGLDESDGGTSEVMFDARNDENRTPLHLAALKGRINIVKFLVRKNQSSMEDEDENGNTPLHLAAQYGQVEVADYLIDAGANVGARNSELCTPMDCAADKGHVGVISLLIKADVPLNAKRRANHTPLFLACKCGHASAVELLLKNGADVSVKDKETGFNCLDIAVENGHKNVAMVIINSDSWKKALRNAVGQQTPMRRMIHKLPDVAHAVLDRCMSDNATEENPDIVNSKDYEVTFDFEFLQDWRPHEAKLSNHITGRNRRNWSLELGEAHGSPTVGVASSVGNSDLSKEKKQAAKWKPVGFSKLHHPLNLMVKYNRGELLRHPVAYALLERKWRRYGRPTFIVNLLTYLLFLLFLTLYALLLPHPHNEYCRNYTVGVVSSLPSENESCPWSNLTIHQDDLTVSMRFGANLVLWISSITVLVTGTARLIWELLELGRKRHRYFLNVENYIEVPAYSFAIAFAIQFGWNCWCPTGWQWPLGALSVFLAWINLILFLKNFPPLGIYVLMYGNILLTFLRVMLIAILFVIAFSLAFYMILFTVLDSPTVSPFASPSLSIHKTVTMTTGDFEYDSIFDFIKVVGLFKIENKDRNLFTDLSSFVAYFLWIVFLVLMPILLVNLLVGLAVDDTKSIQREAHLKRIGLQIKLTLEAQELWQLLPSTRVPGIRLEHSVRPNRRLGPYELLKIAWGVERWDSVDNIQKYRKPDSVVYHIKAQSQKLKSQIKELKAEMRKEMNDFKAEMAGKICSIENLLKNIAQKQGISVTEESS